MLQRTATLVLTLALVAVTAAAAGDKKMTIENALSIRDTGSIQWSPDGKWIAFTSSEWNKKEDRRDSHIYVIASSGGQPIKLTNGERGETSPQWSPEGTRIAFLANREPAQAGAAQTGRGSQIYVISIRGGEAEKLTEEESAVSQFRWSPDGRSIAFITRDIPKDKAEREKRKKEKFDAIVVDSDFTYSHIWTIALDGKDKKEKKRLTEGSFTAADPQWSPDGKWIAYVQNRTGAQESGYTDIAEDRNSDVYIVSSSGGQSRQLTTNPGPDSQPRWSPDGRQIAYAAFEDPKSWAAKTNLMLVSVEGGPARNLTLSYGDSIGGAIEWSPDGRSIYTPGGVGVYSQVLRVPVSGGEPKPVFDRAATYGAFDLSPDGRALAYTFDDSTTPDDIWTSTSEGKDARRISDLNPQIKEFALASTEVIKWKAPDGLEIEGLLVKPLGYQAGTRYPMILQIHGGPYGKFQFGFNSRAQILAAGGYAVLMPNPRGSTGYGNKFTTANLRDWGGKDFGDLMAGVDEVIKMGVADADRLGVMGGSYGGFMTFWVITQTDRFKAAIGHAGISDWYSFHGQSDIPALMEYGFGGMPWAARDVYVKFSPMTFVERVKTPIMITHGEQDRRVPIAQAEEYYRALRKRGVEAVFVRYPREGHGITEPNHQIDLVTRHLEWFDKRVKGERAQAAGTGVR